METPVQTAAGAEAGLPPEGPMRRRLKRAAPVVLAALVLAPGVLLAEPLQQAFANWVIVADAPTPATAGFEGEGGAPSLRRDSYRPHRDAASAVGRTTRGAVAVAPPCDLPFLKLADLQEALPSGGADQTATLGDDDGLGVQTQAHTSAGDGLMAGQTMGDGRSLGGGVFGSGGFGGGLASGGMGGGGGPGAAGSPGPLASSTQAAGPDAGTSLFGLDPSQLANAPDALSAVPEPTTWVSMILGFGLIGAARRRRRGERLQPA